MTSSAIKAQSTTIAVGDAASPEVFTTIPNINSIGGPQKSANDIDVTDLSSTAREFLQGLEDNGQIQLSGYWDSSQTTHQNLRDDCGANTARNYKITFSDSSTIIASARVMEWNLDTSVDEAVVMNCSLKISGDLTNSDAS